MNDAIVKYSILKIIRQPITALVFLLQFIIMFLILIVNISFSGNQITEMNFLGLSLDEPFIVKKFTNNVLSLFFNIIFFLLILIINRFFHEFKNDSLLDIILPKLKNKSTVPYSSSAGVSIVFALSFVIILFIVFLSFKLKYGVAVFIYMANASLLLSLAIIYITSFSLLLNQFIDGFTASIVMIIPFIFGGIIFAWTGSENIFFTVFNFLFPLNKLNNGLILALTGEKMLEPKIFLVLLESIAFLYIGKICFLKKWE